MNDGRRVHVALHDVAPFHLDRVRRAEALMARAGVEKATFLLVPDFHHRGDSAKDERFVKWCRGPHPFEIEWAPTTSTPRPFSAITKPRDWVRGPTVMTPFSSTVHV